MFSDYLKRRLDRRYGLVSDLDDLRGEVVGEFGVLRRELDDVKSRMSNRNMEDAADRAKATSDEPGDLERFFRHGVHRQIHKPPNYFPIYERHLERFRNRPVTMLEIGVSHGGSLQMWKSYLGPEAQIWGVDIDERCKALEEDQIAIRIGDQSDRSFLRELVSEMPEIDIVLDDGGHKMEQQIRSFEEIYPHLAETGVYL